MSYIGRGYTDEAVKSDALKVGGCAFLLFVKIPVFFCGLGAVCWIVSTAFPWIPEFFEYTNATRERRIFACLAVIALCLVGLAIVKAIDGKSSKDESEGTK